MEEWSFLGYSGDRTRKNRILTKKIKIRISIGWRFLGSGETDVNRFDSHPNHENRPLYKGLPHQGLFRGTAGREFFYF